MQVFINTIRKQFRNGLPAGSEQSAAKQQQTTRNEVKERHQ